MRERRFLYFTLGVVAILAVGGAPPLSLENSGIRFPDGSFQTTAAIVDSGTPVHDESTVSISDTDFCSSFTSLYTVPNGKFLIIDWVSIESNSVNQLDPVDVDIAADDGITTVVHTVTRLPDSTQTAGSIFFSTRYSGPVHIYSAQNEVVEGQACRDGSSSDTTVRITFVGKLFDVTGP